MRRQHSKIEQPRLVHHLERALAMLLEATVDLVERLIHVHVDFRAALRRRLRDLLQIIERAGVDGMRSEHNRHSSVRLPMPFVEQRRPRVQSSVAVEYPDQSLTQHAAHAALVNDLRDLLHAWSVHVGERCRPRADHLDRRQRRAPINIGALHLRLDWPDMIIEPIHQRKVVGITPQQRHRRMGVRIDQSRRRKFVPTVNDRRVGALANRSNR